MSIFLAFSITQVLITVTWGSLDIIGFDHCFAVIYDLEKLNHGNKIPVNNWNLHRIPSVRLIPIPLMQRSNINKPATRSALVRIFDSLKSQRSFECFAFFGLKFYGNEAVEVFQDDMFQIHCGTLGTTLASISACHPIETYFIGLYMYDEYLQISPWQESRMSTKVQFFVAQILTDSTLGYGLYVPCLRLWAIAESNCFHLSKSNLDNWYQQKVVQCCINIMWETPTKNGTKFIAQYFEDLKFSAKLELTNADNVNMRIFEALLYQVNVSFTSKFQALDKTNKHVTLRTARSLAKFDQTDQSTHSWFVVDNYEFGAISCADTGLRNDRFVTVFGSLVWLSLLMSLLAIGFILILLLRTSQQSKSHMCKINIVADILVRHLLEQFEDIPSTFKQSISLKMLLIVMSFAFVMIPNAYRGKLAMDFTAPPVRYKIASIQQGLHQSFIILTDVDDTMEWKLRDYFINPQNYKNTLLEKGLTFVEQCHWYRSRFFRMIYNYHQASETNTTRNQFESIIKKFLNSTTNPNWNKTTVDILLNCSKSMMIAQTSSLDHIFVNLQTLKFNPNLYRIIDSTYVTPHVWTIRDEVEWDRRKLIHIKFQSILHSGIFKYITGRALWDKKWKIEQFKEKGELHDRLSDPKFLNIFLALAVMLTACMINFMFETIIDWSKNLNSL